MVHFGSERAKNDDKQEKFRYELLLIQHYLKDKY
jgi:hypothetical protein